MNNDLQSYHDYLLHIFMKKADTVSSADVRNLKRKKVDIIKAITQSPSVLPNFPLLHHLSKLRILGSFEGTFYAVLAIEDDYEKYIVKVPVRTSPYSAWEFAVEKKLNNIFLNFSVPHASVLDFFISSDGRPQWLLQQYVSHESMPFGSHNPQWAVIQGNALSGLHKIKGKGFGLLDPKGTLENNIPTGVHGSWRSYIFCNLDEHVQYLTENGLIDEYNVSRILKLIEDMEENTFVPTLLHGDPNIKNFLFYGSKLRAIVDWEDALIGDPVYEIASWVSFYDNYRFLEKFLMGYGETQKSTFLKKLWTYYLRIVTAKAVHNSKFGHSNLERSIQKIQIAIRKLQDIS